MVAPEEVVEVEGKNEEDGVDNEKEESMGNNEGNFSFPSQDGDDDQLTDEDYDPDIKDDILRPASTRSKIVVNLDEPVSTKKKKQTLDKIQYKLDPYDKVRM